MTFAPIAPLDLDLRLILEEHGPEGAASRLLSLHPVEMTEALEPLDEDDRFAVVSHLPDHVTLPDDRRLHSSLEACDCITGLHGLPGLLLHLIGFSFRPFHFSLRLAFGSFRFGTHLVALHILNRAFRLSLPSSTSALVSPFIFSMVAQVSPA